MLTRTNPKTILDLYGGCGGLSLGAAQAGFSSLASIDIDPILQSGYKRNFPGTKVIEADVSKLASSDWKQLIGSKRPDGIIGGPPCQGFSRIGKRKKDDPRNSLIYHFFRHIAELRPKFFLMENVEGLLDHQNIKSLETALSAIPGIYKVLGPVLINASDFGAPTIRKRIMIVGYDPSEVDEVLLSDLVSKLTSVAVTVKDAIGDLPQPKITKGSDDFCWSKYPDTKEHLFTDYAKKMREPPLGNIGWTEAVERQQRGFVSGLMLTRHASEISVRYKSIAGGKSDPITKSFKLRWDGQCPTLRAGTGPDKGSFQAVRPLHPTRGRVITVREAARLQGFPDWFVFHPTKWHSFRMIGNSVSPLVSAQILGAINSKL